MSLSWVEKYRPKKTDEIIAQSQNISKLIKFVRQYDAQKKKAALLYGDAGCGKTSSVYTIAKEYGFELIEINASDERNKTEIENKMSSVMGQQSLFFSSKIILMDEIDGISSMHDKGGLTALAKIIEKSNFPIIMTANNPWDKKFSTLRKKSLVLEYKPLELDQVCGILKNISDNEKVDINDDAINFLARKNNGDLRSAINDLQSLSGISKKITIDEINDLGERDYTESLPRALIKVFKSKKIDVVVSAFENIIENQDDIIFWIDENIPKEYEKIKDIKNAFRELARADVFRKRIRKWQYWRFMVYINLYLSIGIALSKEKKYNKFVQYVPTTRILKMWMANNKYGKRKEISRKISDMTHTSQKHIIKEQFIYFKKLFESKSPIVDKLAVELDLDDAEIEWMSKKLY